MVEAPLFEAVDCVLLRVSDLDAALSFYEGNLGHRLVWRSAVAAGLALPGSKAELVLHTEVGPEVDMLVTDVEAAIKRFVAAGGVVMNGPFDVPTGKAAVVRDPFGNVLTILDQSRGLLSTDRKGWVIER